MRRKRTGWTGLEAESFGGIHNQHKVTMEEGSQENRYADITLSLLSSACDPPLIVLDKTHLKARRKKDQIMPSLLVSIGLGNDEEKGDLKVQRKDAQNIGPS